MFAELDGSSTISIIYSGTEHTSTVLYLFEFDCHSLLIPHDTACTYRIQRLLQHILQDRRSTFYEILIAHSTSQNINEHSVLPSENGILPSKRARPEPVHRGSCTFPGLASGCLCGYSSGNRDSPQAHPHCCQGGYSSTRGSHQAYPRCCEV